ncbi:MAG: ribonuclease III [Clostridiaceae bacterium]|nr:ribonuclease III [Clostridiaceae bacterium]
MSAIDTKRLKQLNEFENVIGYSFKNINILNNALTHSSYIGSKSDFLEHNERLEFIGDAILDMVISLYLYSKCKNSPEGSLTRFRAGIVCEHSLYNASNRLKLGQYLLLSKGEENTGGRKRVSILADAFEAIIAAIYLDGGIKKTKTFILANLEDIINDAVEHRLFSDYKSFLQEYIQKNNLGKLSYKLLKEKGPDHDKTFDIALYLDNGIIGRGAGHSKKDAQQAAARDAIKGLGVKNE